MRFFIWLLLLAGLGRSFAAETLRVGVWEDEPFSYRQGERPWEGLSVEIWEACARLRGWTFEYVETSGTNAAAMVQQGHLDLLVTPLSINVQHENHLDFSHIYHISGLGVAVRNNAGLSVTELVTTLFSRSFAKMAGALGLTLLVAGGLVWLFERKRNPEQFGKLGGGGIGSGFWWAVVTLTTVGYGDKVPKTPAGRAVSVVWMLIGFFILAGWTGHISSLLTVHRLKSHIRNIQDLSHNRVGVVANSPAQIFLAGSHIKRELFPTLQAALTALGTGKLDAVVAGEALLKSNLARKDFGDVSVLPFLLTNEPCAFALKSGNLQREPLDRAILEFREGGLLTQIISKYLD